MLVKNSRQIKSKAGNIIPVGSLVEVTPGKHGYKAVVAFQDFTINIPMIKLGLYFPGFLSPTKIQREIERCAKNFDISVCKSMTGETVELDGHDSKGFPSILIAGGYL